MIKRKKKDSIDESKGTPISEIKKRIVKLKILVAKLSALIYGRSGTGKTTFAATMADILEPDKKVLLIDVREEGQDSIVEYGDRIEVLQCTTWDDLVGVYHFLHNGDHNFGGVIIDTVTQAQSLAMKWAIKKSGNHGMMSRRSWGFLGSALTPLLLDFRDLPMHVCFIAQDRKTAGDEAEDEITDLMPEFGPALMPSVAKDLNAMVKIIGQTHIKMTEVKVKGKKPRQVPRFRMRLGPHPLYLTKIRSPKSAKIPASIVDPSFAKIQKIMRGESL